VTRAKNDGVRVLLFSIELIEDEQQNPFSVVCSHRTSLYTVINIHNGDLCCLNMCSVDFHPIHWKEQKIFNAGEITAHKPVQWTKVVVERVS